MKSPASQDHDAVVLLDELLAIASPPGREGRMAAHLAAKAQALGYAAELDPAGNVLVHLNPSASGPPLILAAHMDEIALVVSRVESDGRLRVVRSGGMKPAKLGERIVDILGDREIIAGVISSGTEHVARQESSSISWSDYWITTGLSPAQLRERGVHPGSAIVPAREGRGPLVFGDPEKPLVAAWTFDDRMGLVTLLRLLARQRDRPAPSNRPVIIAFTVHEEGGAHGAKNLCHREQPEIFIAIDGCPLVPGSGLALDAGPAIWAKDLKANYDHRLILAFQEIADALGHPLQRAVLENAYSDASASYDTGGAPRVGVIGHVRENSHGFEIACLRSFDQLLDLIEEFLHRQPA